MQDLQHAGSCTFSARSLKEWQLLMLQCGCAPQEGVPEDMSGMRHLKIDVYAFGVTLWEMLMRQRPHGDLHAFQIQVCVEFTHFDTSG